MGLVVAPGIESVLESLTGQQAAPSLHVVLADAGADPDASAHVRQWTQESPFKVSHIRSAEALPEARNAILEFLTADADPLPWVTFPEAGDTFASDYFAQVSRELDGDTVVVSARQYQWDPATGDRAPHLQLDAPYKDGATARVDLVRSPEQFPVVLRTAFINLEAVALAGARFAPELAYGFGELDFMCRVLAKAVRPLVRFVDVAYDFQVRDDVATGGKSYSAHPEKFTTVLERGHLALLRDTASEHGIPEFVQHAVLFDLGWYFRADEALSSQMNAEMHGVEDEFHAHVAGVLQMIDPHVLEGLSPRRLPIDRYVAWRFGYRGVQWHAPTATLTAIDQRRSLVCVSYYYTWDMPVEDVLLDGTPAQPVYAKSRDIIYAGRTLARERILWVPRNHRVVLKLEGTPVPLGKARPARAHTRWSPHELEAALVPEDAGAPIASSAATLAARYLGITKARSWIIRTIAASGPVRRRFAKSWVLMDRVDAAHDNAEHLFKYLREAEPDRPVWFALDRKSQDFRRLKKEGVGNLLAYGSFTWMLVCLNATHVLSSQAGPYVDNPQALRKVRRPRWRFVFLQHGVVHTGLHRWLNRRNFDLFLTTTSAEYAAIVGDRSPYRFTPHEVALTGMPRFDRLYRLAADVTEPGAIVVAPTWRESLFDGKADAKGLRAQRDDFTDTDYARQWREFLTSPQLAEVARTSGRRVDFMPHPNIKPYLEQFGLPDYINVLSYATHDVQRVLADAAVLVTDYSSIAFDAAYIGRPVVYFQFDRADVFRGAHTIRQGYFSYDEDGFGSVVKTAEAAVDAVASLARAGFAPLPEHRTRMEEAFPFHDDLTCERVVTAVAALDTPVAPGEQVDVPVAPRPRPSPRD